MTKYSTNFIQKIFDHDGYRHIHLTYNTSMDFVPFLGLHLDLDAPFWDWSRVQIDKIIWTTHNSPKFQCYLNDFKYQPGSHEYWHVDIDSFDEILRFYEKLSLQMEQTDDLMRLSVKDYNFRAD